MMIDADIGRSRVRFSTNEYRINSIRVVDGKGHTSVLFFVGSPVSSAPTILRYGESFRLQVDYECLMPQLPSVSCGVAAALTRREDMQHGMYFNTNYPHSDEEMRAYYDQEFRKYIGRHGTVEAYFPWLQIKPENYLLTVGILPNQLADHDFYELHSLQYPVTVLPGAEELPAAFYPNVKFRHRSLEPRCRD